MTSVACVCRTNFVFSFGTDVKASCDERSEYTRHGRSYNVFQSWEVGSYWFVLHQTKNTHESERDRGPLLQNHRGMKVYVTGVQSSYTDSVASFLSLNMVPIFRILEKSPSKIVVLHARRGSLRMRILWWQKANVYETCYNSLSLLDQVCGGPPVSFVVL